MRRVTDEMHDEGRLGGDTWWNDWFAGQLGERWQTSGDGIYTYVHDDPPAPGSRPAWGEGPKDRYQVPDISGT